MQWLGPLWWTVYTFSGVLVLVFLVVAVDVYGWFVDRRSGGHTG